MTRVSATRPFFVALALAGFAIVAPARAQDAAYPTKPVRFIVPFVAGSATDLVGRIISQRLAEDLGQPFIVENRPGAGGNIGSEAIARGAPDGYTLGMGVVGVHGINPHLFRNMPFDAIKDFQPISLVATAMQVLAVNGKLPVRSLAELIAYAKARPGEINFGSPGNGSTGQLAGAMLETATGIRMTRVPFNGAAAVRNALLSGDVQVAFELETSLVPHLKSGGLRALAVTGPARSRALPDLPTMVEAGVPGFEVTTWMAVVGPAGLPAAVVDRLNARVRAALARPETIQKFEAVGTTPSPSSPAELRERMERDNEKWGRAVRAAGVKLD
jgi:tripartite-type tricarboxylate transporter receptor subunit TctC